MFLCLLWPQILVCNGSLLHHSGDPFCVFALVSNMSVDWIGYGYAAVIATGGVVGYAKARSVPSLAAGLLFGGLAGFGAYQISSDPGNVWVSLATSGALTGIMGKRFFASKKFMPAGLIAGTSLLMVGKLSLALLQKP
ncbi:unnamed protein product, partial [Tetraodon nigroviridis]